MHQKQQKQFFVNILTSSDQKMIIYDSLNSSYQDESNESYFIQIGAIFAEIHDSEVFIKYVITFFKIKINNSKIGISGFSDQKWIKQSLNTMVVVSSRLDQYL